MLATSLLVRMDVLMVRGDRYHHHHPLPTLLQPHRAKRQPRLHRTPAWRRAGRAGRRAIQRLRHEAFDAAKQGRKTSRDASPCAVPCSCMCRCRPCRVWRDTAAAETLHYVRNGFFVPDLDSLTYMYSPCIHQTACGACNLHLWNAGVNNCCLHVSRRLL